MEVCLFRIMTALFMEVAAVMECLTILNLDLSTQNLLSPETKASFVA
jgi:hypothetical protein